MSNNKKYSILITFYDTDKCCKILSKMKESELVEYCQRQGINGRELAIIKAYRNGCRGEKLIDTIISQGFDFSKSTKDRDIVSICKKLNIDTIKKIIE